MIHNLANSLASRLANYIGWQGQIPYLTYGLELIIGETLKLVILLALAAGLGLFQPIVLMLAAALPYRLISGGGHLTTYAGCTVVTITVYLALAALTKALMPFFNNSLFFVALPALYAISMMVIYLWVPGGHPAKDISQNAERLKFRRLSRIIVSLWALSCLAVYTTLPEMLPVFFISTAMGIIWQDFFVSPLGYKFLNVVEKIFGASPGEVN